jgi:hypothetical protein
MASCCFELRNRASGDDFLVRRAAGDRETPADSLRFCQWKSAIRHPASGAHAGVHTLESDATPLCLATEHGIGVSRHGADCVQARLSDDGAARPLLVWKNYEFEKLNG